MGLGFGVQGGAEAAVHSLRRYVNTMGDDDIIVKLYYDGGSCFRMRLNLENYD